jgi:hypothetical protein
MLPSNLACSRSKVIEYLACDARRTWRKGGAKVGLGGVGLPWHEHEPCVATAAQQCHSSSVPLALADEVQKWPVSFEATIEADVLQSTQNSAGIG